MMVLRKLKDTTSTGASLRVVGLSWGKIITHRCMWGGEQDTGETQWREKKKWIP